MTSGSHGYVVASHEGSVWNMQPGRPAIFELFAEQTGGRIAVFEEAVPPGAGTALHLHRNADEVLYVVSGDFTFRLGEVSQSVAVGSWVFVPLGSVHGWRNSGSEDGRLFSIFTPGDGAKPFEEMGREGKSLPEIDVVTRDAIFARYGMEVITRNWE